MRSTFDPFASSEGPLAAARVRRIVGTTALFSLLFTIAVTTIPFIRFAYRSPNLHIALDTAIGLVALLAGYLVYGRFSLTRSWRDLVLTASLLILGITNLMLSTLPSVILENRERFFIWGVAGGRLAGAIFFAFSAVTRDRVVPVKKRYSAWMLVAVSLAVPVAIASLLGIFQLDPGISPSLSPNSSNRPLLIGHPLLLSVQLAAMVLYGLAALGLGRRARETHDELLLWLAAGAAMSSFARMNYFLFPSIYSDWVYTGDFLRIGAHVLFLVGAGREIRNYWRRVGELAVAEERRRLARELHDGVAQELALIAGYAQLLGGSEHVGGRDPRKEILSASQRALTEARSAISALSDRRVEQLDVAVARTAASVASRHGAPVEVRVEKGITVPLATTEMFTRITSEAVANAARHGKPQTITVDLTTGGGGIVLRVADDGCGFDPEAAAAGQGFGLISMRERAESLGARFKLESRPQAGTVIEVSVSP
ncbi:MAG TPA: ATP-binding protein [Actinomycetota bacterium]|nr:ATP-binding protein [Actinomycetota bacterium]